MIDRHNWLGHALTVVWLGLVIVAPGSEARAQATPDRARQSPRFSAPNEPPLAGAAPRPGGPQGTGAAEPVDPPAPTVAVRVRVAAQAAAGRDLEYRLLVENTSTAAAHHVLLRVPLPAHAKFARAEPEPTGHGPELRWELGTMSPRDRHEISLILVPSGEGEIRCCAHVQFEHGQCVRTQLARSALQLHKDGPTRAMLYDALTYHLGITNTGSAAARDVRVTDTLPDGLEFSTSTPSTSGDNPLTWNLGTLSPGQSRRIEYQLFAKKSGTFNIKAVATAAGSQRQDFSSTLVIEEAKLDAVTTGPKQRIVNRPAVYQIHIANTGTMAVTGLEIEDRFPEEGVAFESASDGGRFDGSAVRWSLGALAPGARRSVQLVVRGKTRGWFTNKAIITAMPRIERIVIAPVTFFEGASALTVEIDKRDDPLEVGRRGTYTVRVLNQGSAAANNLGLSVTANEYLKITEGRGPTPARQAGNRLVFAPLPVLAAGQHADFTIDAEAVHAGEARLNVELTADQLASGTSLKQEESTTVVAP